jgi:hypothetical protein
VSCSFGKGTLETPWDYQKGGKWAQAAYEQTNVLCTMVGSRTAALVEFTVPKMVSTVSLLQVIQTPRTENGGSQQHTHHSQQVETTQIFLEGWRGTECAMHIQWNIIQSLKGMSSNVCYDMNEPRNHCASEIRQRPEDTPTNMTPLTCSQKVPENY